MLVLLVNFSCEKKTEFSIMDKYYLENFTDLQSRCNNIVANLYWYNNKSKFLFFILNDFFQKNFENTR